MLEWTAGENGVRVRHRPRRCRGRSPRAHGGRYSDDVARLPAGHRSSRTSGARLAPADCGPSSSRTDRFRSSTSSSTEGTSTASRSSGPGLQARRYDYEGERGDPDTISRELTPEDEAPLRRFAERYFPEARALLTLKTCLFELSPDEHFLIDHHPESEHAVVGAGFSGHGFKFCSVVGEILADLALEGETRHDIEFLRFGRRLGL